MTRVGWPKVCMGCGKPEGPNFTHDSRTYTNEETIGQTGNYRQIRTTSLPVHAVLCKKCTREGKKRFAIGLVIFIQWTITLIAVAPGLATISFYYPQILTLAPFAFIFFWIFFIGIFVWIGKKYHVSRHYHSISQSSSTFTFTFKSPIYAMIFQEGNRGLNVNVSTGLVSSQELSKYLRTHPVEIERKSRALHDEQEMASRIEPILPRRNDEIPDRIEPMLPRHYLERPRRAEPQSYDIESVDPQHEENLEEDFEVIFNAYAKWLSNLTPSEEKFKTFFGRLMKTVENLVREKKWDDLEKIRVLYGGGQIKDENFLQFFLAVHALAQYNKLGIEDLKLGILQTQKKLPPTLSSILNRLINFPS